MSLYLELILESNVSPYLWNPPCSIFRIDSRIQPEVIFRIDSGIQHVLYLELILGSNMGLLFSIDSGIQHESLFRIES